MRFLRILVFTLFFSCLSQAADLRALTKIFEKHFFEIWQQNRCVENTFELVNLAVKAGVNMDQAWILELSYPTSSHFGMITGYRAREGGDLIIPQPTRPPYLAAGEESWDFHVFLIAPETQKKRSSGEVRIFDLSFENTPQTPFVSDYLDTMFLPPTVPANLTHREKYLSGFKVKIYDPLTNGKAVDETYLKNFIPSYFSQMPDSN